MDRLVSIRHMELFGGCSARTAGPGSGRMPAPPWTLLDGHAEGDDGRTYSWSIVTTAEVGALDARSEGWTALPDLADVPLWLHHGEPPVVVVEAPHFGPALLDALRFGPAWLRAQVFYPVLTEAEREWLDDLDRRDAEELVPRVVGALEAELGVPLRIEADRAVRAAQLMLQQGYVIPAAHLFSAHPELFSSAACAIVTSWLAEHAPD